MDYKNIETKFIKHFKETNTKDRLIKRNPNDERLKLTYIYVEVHHILPRSLGGDNSKENLVEVLPEEHIFLHMLRYKIYKQREDMLSVRFCLNGFDKNKTKMGINYNNIILNKKIRTGYAWIKTHSYNFRKEIGWHTEEGIKAISEARMGTFPAKCANTGESVGSVSNKHPKVLSGEWVHTSKGRELSEDEKIKKGSKGFKNGKSINVTKDDLINYMLELTEIENRIPAYIEVKRYVEKKYDINIPSSHKTFRFKNKSIYEYVEDKTGLIFNKYYRSPERIRKISNSLKNRKNN